MVLHVLLTPHDINLVGDDGKGRSWLLHGLTCFTNTVYIGDSSVSTTSQLTSSWSYMFYTSNLLLEYHLFNPSQLTSSWSYMFYISEFEEKQVKLKNGRSWLLHGLTCFTRWLMWQKSEQMYRRSWLLHGLTCFTKK